MVDSQFFPQILQVNCGYPDRTTILETPPIAAATDSTQELK